MSELEIPNWLSSTIASDAAAGAGTLAHWVASQQRGRSQIGRAVVVTVSRDDNAPLRDVIAAGPAAGSILVVGGAGESRTACIGDLMGRELQAVGIDGIVTDGLVRDLEDLRAISFGVWSRGTCTTASAKKGPGVIGGHTALGGVTVRDGDLVVADTDGVVVWPADDVEALLARAADKWAADEERLARLTGSN